MSLAVTSIMTWWFLRPLIAANMPRIMRGSFLSRGELATRSGDLVDGREAHAVDTADGQDGLAVHGGGALDGAGLRHALGVDVGHGAADQVHGAGERQLRGDLLVGRG